MVADVAIDRLPFRSLLAEIVDNRGRSCPTSDDGIALIATNCIHNDQLYPTYEKVRWVSLETYSTWFRGHPQPGDIIFVNKGTPGRVCLVPDPVDFCIAQDMVAVRADPGLIDPLYLFALLRSPVVQNQIANMYVGTLIPHFKKGDFERLHLPVLRDRKAQERIGRIHFEFCQKIELNRRMNETLEAMAQALFKSWFVDFDPVLDKAFAAGNPIPDAFADRAAQRAAVRDQYPPLPDHLLALFPDRFQDSPLGPIPEGWSTRSLDKIADYMNGTACQKHPPVPGQPTLPVIKIRELRQGITDNTDRATTDVPGQYLVADGDVLFSWSGSLLVDVWSQGPGVLNQHVFKVTSDEFPKWFFYYWTKRHLLNFQQIAADKATTMGHIKRSHLREALVAVPGPGLVEAAGAQIAPILDRQLANSLQSRELVTTRDLLLPRLVSGEESASLLCREEAPT